MSLINYRTLQEFELAQLKISYGTSIHFAYNNFEYITHDTKPICILHDYNLIVYSAI